MPILRYITWVGAGLLTLLFAFGGALPKTEPGVERPMSYKIAVQSQQRGPEAVSFSGENRVFAPPRVATADEAAAIRVRDAFASLDAPKLADNTPSAPAAVEAPKPKKVAKRRIRQPAYDDMQAADQGFGYERRNLAYSRNFDAPAQRRSFW